MEMFFTFVLLQVTVLSMLSQGCAGENELYNSCSENSIGNYLVKTILKQEKDLAQCRQQHEEYRSIQCEICPESYSKAGLDIFINSLFDQPKEFNNKTYYLSTITANATQADKYCIAIGGYLVEIDDIYEFQFARNLVTISNYEYVYIAGSDAANEGTWIFQRTGEMLPFLDWKVGEPNNRDRNEHCLILWKGHTGKMNDALCTSSYPFVCEV